MKQKQFAIVVFEKSCYGTQDLQIRHYCGGTAVKLPRNMADFRRQWVDLNAAKTQVGRHEIIKIIFH